MNQEFTHANIPRVCGFNLLGKFSWRPEAPRGGKPFEPWDFDFMARHGFRFARLPMDYRVWTLDLDGPRRQLDPAVLDEVATAVDMGAQRGIHVCVNIHRGPGYCINQPELEPFNLWTDGDAQECFAHHWRALARRLEDFPNRACSLDLLNEPPSYGQRGFTKEVHAKVMGLAVQAIREVSPDRLIICDGHSGGHWPNDELVELGVAQSMRGYIPFQVSHYKASWVGRPADATWTAPSWPMREKGDFPWNAGPWDKQRLAREVYEPWRQLQAKGVGVHCGEMGVYNQTPPAVTYAFLEDLLSIFDEALWGWAMWNLRGSFGVLDTGRPGVKTEDCDGHQLDREMLEILKRHI